MPESAAPAAEPKKIPPDNVTLAVKKWKNKRGSLIMALHDLQGKMGYVPREAALKLAEGMNVPLARIYEVITFYHYFKLEPPGKAVISICTGTACYLKGSMAVVQEFEKELAIPSGTSTPDKLFHLQSVRCVGCCGLAPVGTVNGKTYGKMSPSSVKKIIEEWRAVFAAEEAASAPASAAGSAAAEASA